uniref:Uncharacterized protein n=1 Tax=Haptolina ericina TaxID=156174 RepID=A0A7S3AC49_9EUKA|mmetsp:Transcript_1130/g.2416  ORF Transcript_1130/g.2416 Transcript_1130/m.2416 type:complete len:138 (+) Transcript_1130:148-561(+)
MGAAQSTGRSHTCRHVLLDVRHFESVDAWVRSLPRSARRNLARATGDDAGFTVRARAVRGGAPAPHSSLVRFRLVVEHAVRVLAERPDELLGAFSAAINRYGGTTKGRRGWPAWCASTATRATAASSRLRTRWPKAA